MNWQKPAAISSPQPQTGAPSVSQITPPWALESNPSTNTKYVTYDHSDGTYTAVVMESKGTGSKNTLIGENMRSLTDLQNLCDKDWATGARK